MKRLEWGGLVLAVLLTTSVVAAPRVWTEAEGSTFQGEFIREAEGEVSFLKEGKLITKRLDQLSQSDQQVVRDLQAGSPLRDEQPQLTTPPQTLDTPRPPKAPGGATEPSADNENTVPKAQRKKPAEISNRVWTDIFGNQMTAKFVRVFDGNVVLSRLGRPSTVRYCELTSADQEYVKELLVSQGQEALIPTLRAVGEANQTPGGDAASQPGMPAAPGPLPGFAALPPMGRREPSEFFEELRERDAERRELQAERMAEVEQRRQEAQARLQQHQAVAVDPVDVQHGREAKQALADTGAQGAVAVSSQVASGAQKWLILLIVVGGVIGAVLVVVFAAMTIASASSVAKQRQYR